MLKKLMISAAASALMVSGAMAQASPPADPPKAAAPKADAAPVDAAKFIASQSADQWVFSKFKGTDVLGPDDAQVGDVNDILYDKQGKILALIVGVGGFLGIGEKSVAIDMSAFQVVPASTGSTSGAGAAMGSDDPTNVKLKVSWTKEQVKNAPEFQYYKPPASTGMAPRPQTPPMAPRQ
jgi:PRC-barrel domain